jgi:hypothetical protein
MNPGKIDTLHVKTSMLRHGASLLQDIKKLPMSEDVQAMEKLVINFQRGIYGLLRADFESSPAVKSVMDLAQGMEAGAAGLVVPTEFGTMAFHAACEAETPETDEQRAVRLYKRAHLLYEDAQTASEQASNLAHEAGQAEGKARLNFEEAKRVMCDTLVGKAPKTKG